MSEPTILDHNDTLYHYSTHPPTTFLTFGYWIYMVPQYKPENILILGYAGGTIAGLIRLLYGDVRITAVDINDCIDPYNVNLIKADAREFVKTCAHFDCVIVDLFTAEVPCAPIDFVTSKEFIQDLKRIANYIIVNGYHSDMKPYEESGLRKMGVNKPSGSAEHIYYFEVNNPIPNLHPWK